MAGRFGRKGQTGASGAAVAVPVAGFETFEARYSPARSILLGLLSLGFVAVALWMVGFFGDAPTDSRRMPDWMIPILGWLSIALFGPIGLYHLSRAFRPGVAVRVDEAGMMIAGYGAQPIPWEDFTGFSSMNMMGTEMLQFDVVPDRMDSFGLLKRILWKLNEPFNGKGGSLVINNTDCKHRELVQAIKNHGPPRLTQWLR